MGQDISSRVAWSLRRAIEGVVRNEARPSEGTARVVATDADGTVWVRLPGSDVDTPANGMVTTVTAPGQEVHYRLANGRLSVTGNASSPAVGGAYVTKAVAPVAEKADEALGEAARAFVAADAAEADARRANEAANEAVEDAATANAAAAQAQADATTANAAAAQAQADATAAGTAASAAQASATQANTAANDALTQLSTVQDVVGTVEWAATHSGQDMATYISSHLALTDDGLWVLKDASGYKVLLANDGMSVVDPQGHVVTTFGESISFNSSRPQYIGGEDAHISYYDSDDDGVPDSIYIGGTNVAIGGKTLSQFTQAIDDATAARRYAEDVPIVTLSSTNGTVFKRNSGVSTTVVATIFTPAGRIDNATELHRRFGAGAYLEWGWRDVVTDAAHVLVLSDPRIIMDGFGLVISPDDIDAQAVITCSLNY